MRLGHIYEDRSDSKAAEDASSSSDEEAEKAQQVQSEVIQLKNTTEAKKCHLKDQDSLEDLMTDLCNGLENGATEGKKWIEWRCRKCSKTHVLVLAQV